MDRAEKIGLGTAVAGHVLLFALLSARFLSVSVPTPVQQPPLEVSLVKDVALDAAAPQAVEPPAPSVAPDRGAPEDAAPPEPADVAPRSEPQSAPPVEKPAPAKPKPVPAPAKPVEKPAPVPKPVAAPKPAPMKKPTPEAAAPEKTATKSSPTKTAPTKASAAAASSHAKPAAAKGTGSDVTAKTVRPRGSLLGDDFLKGLSDKPSKSTAVAPVAAKAGAQELANIGSAILRQVQPCANRQTTPGPGAERIRVTINLRLNRDGSLAARPRITGHDGVDDENQRYLTRIDDLAIATFTGCSPLHGLPDALYDVQNGWSNFSLRYKLPG